MIISTVEHGRESFSYISYHNCYDYGLVHRGAATKIIYYVLSLNGIHRSSCIIDVDRTPCSNRKFAAIISPTVFQKAHKN